MTKRKRKIALISAGGFIFLSAWVVLFGWVHVETMLYDALYPDTAFSSDEWKEGGPRRKGRMLYDLLYNVDMEGKTAGEITGLLGEPDGKLENEDGTFSYSYGIDIGVREFGVWPFCDTFYYIFAVNFTPEGISRSYSLNN